jgi:cell fate (sporulation/competence/biofilm development) regulator YlbF (YheA/YmcA/DUF963 family)
MKDERRDLQREGQEQRNELLEIVREQSKELDFLGQVVKWIVRDQELARIREVA